MKRGMPALTDFLNDPKVKAGIAEGRFVVHGPRSETIRRERETISAKLTESDFTQMVLDYAGLMGWHTAHFRPGMNRRGEWQTAVAGNGKGFLDVLMIRERLVVAELKVGKNDTTPEQDQWIERWKRVGVTPYVWRPSSWDEIRRVLA